MSVILVYVTNESREAAEKLASSLLEKRLIACVNLFPIDSIYRWEGRIERGKEVVSLFKTRDTLWEDVKRHVEAVHPYKTPCILRIDAAANEAFGDWVDGETHPDDR